jgi:hypothetical protein
LEAGAMRYAAERTGQDHKFTKYPTTWLNGDCWTDEPPPSGLAAKQSAGASALAGMLKVLESRNRG